MLEKEHQEMRDLSVKLSSIRKTDGQQKLKEAREIISKLRTMNLRWNISALNDFLNRQYKELFLNI